MFIQLKLRNKAIVASMALLLSPLLLLPQYGNANTTSQTKTATSKTVKPSASLRFTLSDRHGSPQDQSRSEFDCQDKIYAVTELDSFKKGKHHVEFRWIDPNGGTRERTEYDFYISNEPTTKLWAWLELSRAQGAAMIQWLNPAAGLEEFIGEWKLELLLNGKVINTGNFDVNC